MGAFDDLIPQSGGGMFDDLLPSNLAPDRSLRPVARGFGAPEVADAAPVQPVTGRPEASPLAIGGGATPARTSAPGLNTPAPDAAPDAAQSRLEPFDPKKHQAQDIGLGGPSTEYIVTNDAPGGGFWNIPSIWWDENGKPQLLDQDRAQEQAIAYERETGKKFPRYKSAEEGSSAAEARSAAGGAENGALAQQPEPYNAFDMALRRQPGPRPPEEPDAVQRAIQRGAIRVQSSFPAHRATMEAARAEEQTGGFGSAREMQSRADYLMKQVAAYEEELPALEAADPEAADTLRGQIDEMRQQAESLRVGASTPSAVSGQARRQEEASAALQRAVPSLIELRRLSNKAAALPMSDAAEAVKKRLAEAPNTVGGTFDALMENPAQSAAFIGEIGLESTPAIGASIAAAIITRNPELSAAILGVGAFAQEYGASVDEFLQENGVKISNEEEAAAVLSNPKLMDEADKRGLRRGIVIAAAEVLGQKVTGVVEKAMSPVKGAVTSTGVQAATGAGGESAARAAAGQEQSPQDIILEAVAETFTAPAEIAAAAMSDDSRATPEQLAKLTDTDRASPLADDTIAKGKAKIDEMLAANRGGPAAALNVAPEKPQTPEGVPQGAVPMSDLYDDATEAPASAPERPEAPALEQQPVAPEQESAASPGPAPAEPSGRAPEGQRSPAGDRFEDFPEIDKDKQPTGRTIRFDKETGQARVLEPETVQNGQNDQNVQPEPDRSQTGAEPEMTIGNTDSQTAPTPSESSTGTETDAAFPSIKEAKPVAMGPVSVTPRPIADGKPLYRETNADGLDDILRLDGQPDTMRAYVTDNRDLAIGQGENRGITITFRPDSLSGEINQKPGTSEETGLEYRTDMRVANAVAKIEIPKPMLRKVGGVSARILKRDFDRSNEGDMAVFTRRGYQVETKPIEGGEVAPAKKPETSENIGGAKPNADSAGAGSTLAANDNSGNDISDKAAPLKASKAQAAAASYGHAVARRDATNFLKARIAAKEFQGKEIENRDSGIKASVSRNALDKMLSNKAVNKSESQAAHSLAIANIDALFENAVHGWAKQDAKGEPSVVGVHRFFARMNKPDGAASMVKMTVKETSSPKNPNPLYTVEAVEFLDDGASAATWVTDSAAADGVDLRNILSAETVENIARGVEEDNAQGESGKARRPDEKRVDEGARPSQADGEQDNEPVGPVSDQPLQDQTVREGEGTSKELRESQTPDGKLRAGTPQAEWLRDIILPMMPALRRELDRLGLKNVGLYIDDNAERALDGVQGMFNAYWNGRMDILIGQSLDPLATMHHEAIHALRNMRLFTNAEWKALELRAAGAWMKRYDIEGRYPDLTRAEQIEEAIAEEFAQWAKGGETPGQVAKLFEKILAFFEALRNAMNGAGFQTADDVFARAFSGEVGNRPDQVGGQELMAAQKEQKREAEAPKSQGDTDPSEGQVTPKSVAAAFASQPIDQIARLPFHVVGGLDEFGRWKPGKKITDAVARKIMTPMDPDGRFGFMASVMENAKRGLIDRYGLDPEYVERERRRSLDARALLVEGQEHVEALMKAGYGSEESRVLHAVLTGEAVPDAEMAKLSEPIRNAIDALGTEAVALGLLSEEAYERNKGSYLHRVYLKHEAAEGALSKAAMSFFKVRRKRIIGKQFKGRGMFDQQPADAFMRRMPEGSEKPKVGDKLVIYDRLAKPSEDGGKPRVLERRYVPAGETAAADMQEWTNRGLWEVRGVSDNRITIWRDFTKKERQQMGEILDARYTIARTFMQMSNDLATGRFFKDIAENDQWAKAEEPDEKWLDGAEYGRFWNDPSIKWVLVPSTKIPKTKAHKFGALAGKYVRAEIWRDLNELEVMNSPGWWRKILTFWKANKTIRSPGTHVNNVMSNLTLMDLADVRMPDLARGMNSYLRGDAIYQEALENGAFGSDMVAQEMKRNTLDPILKDLQKEIVQDAKRAVRADEPLAFKVAMALPRAVGKVGTALPKGAIGFAKWSDKKAAQLYQAEDEVFRMATYIRRRDQGASPEQAAIEARDQFLNYDIRAPWVNAVRNSVFPFISYTYRAVPMIAQSLAYRPWKIGKYATLAYLANTLAYELAPSDDDEDEERRSMRREQQGLTWLGTPRMVRMPWLDEYQNPVFLDVRRWIPAGDVFDTNQGHGAINVPSWLQFGGPLMIGAELALNKAAFTGEPITNELIDTPAEKAAGAAAHVYKAFVPGLFFGSWHGDKISAAWSGAQQWGTGRQYSLTQAVASAIGVKISGQDVDLGFRFREFEVKDQMEELERKAWKLKSDQSRGLKSQKAFDEEMGRLKQKYNDLMLKAKNELKRR